MEHNDIKEEEYLKDLERNILLSGSSLEGGCFYIGGNLEYSGNFSFRNPVFILNS